MAAAAKLLQSCPTLLDPMDCSPPGSSIHGTKPSILRHSAFFTVQFSHPYMTTGKTIALTRRTFVGKIMSLLLNMLSRLVITFLPRSKRLLISASPVHRPQRPAGSTHSSTRGLRPVLVPGSRRAASTQWELGMRVPPDCMQPHHLNCFPVISKLGG